VDHYVSWHTGDGVATDLLGELTPIVHSLIDHTIVLTIGTFGSLATLRLAEVDDRLHCILGVDLNLVEDGVGAHWISPCRCSYYRATSVPVRGSVDTLIRCHTTLHLRDLGVSITFHNSVC